MPARPRVKRPRAATSTRALAQGVAMSMAVGKLACSASPPAPDPPPAPTATAAATATATAPAPATAAPLAEQPPPVADPSPQLAPYTVTNASFARRTLYTWTTAEQVGELVRTRTLLSRSESPKYGRSFFDRTMEQRWMLGDKLASLLRAPAYAKARFGWPAAWATLLGWPGETYGTELVEVTLEPQAWLAMYRTSTRTWDVRDLQGAAIAIDDVLKHPERLAAVHFVHDDVRPPSTSGATPGIRMGAPRDGGEAYREYVLCNESMIESWSVGTDRVTAEIAASADAVEAAAKYFAIHPPPAQRQDRWNVHVAFLVWPTVVPQSTPKELYEAALAFPNANYVIDAEALRKLAERMRTLKQRATSTTHRPMTPFPGAKPVAYVAPPAPPRTVYPRRRYGTF